jgi:DNA-binding FrmR family transcriptional regulator
MPITDDSKEKLKARLAKAMGHLNAVHRMVDEKKYCIDVLHQMKAVQSALDKISEEILRQHLATCVVEAVESQDADRVIEELVQVFRRAPELNLDSWQTPRPTPELGGASNGKNCCH